MEVFIPVIPSTNYGGPWGRDPFRRLLAAVTVGRCAYRNPELNRLRRGHQSCSPARSAMMPCAVRLVDEMDMNDWITPADLISAALLLGANAAAGVVEEQNRATEAPTSPAKESQVAGADKNVFEVEIECLGLQAGGTDRQDPERSRYHRRQARGNQDAQRRWRER